MHTSTTSRRSIGERVPPFSLETLSHGRIRVPDGRYTHLQFRRFAGCPVCNLHLRTFSAHLPRLDAVGVRTIAFFHSSEASMRPYQGELPLAVVPDPDRRWYEAFGVEESTLSVAHPSAMWAGLKGLATVPSSPIVGEGGHSGLPADFLIDATGAIVAVRYGSHANDQWSVDEVIALAGGGRAGGAR